MGFSSSEIKNWRNEKQGRWIDFRWFLAGALILFTFILGYIGFNRYYALRGESHTYLDKIYVTIQLFVLESGAVKGPVNWELELARLLSPAIAAYTIFITLGILFKQQFKLLRLKFIHDHIIICGSGLRIHLLANKFREYGFKVVLVNNDEMISSNKKNHAYDLIELNGDARDQTLLYKVRIHKAKYLILFDEDDKINIEIAVKARQLTLKDKSKTLTCIVHIVDPQLCRLLNETEMRMERKEAFRLEYFDIFDAGARYLLKKYPPFGKSKIREDLIPHVLIIGMDQLGESLLLHIINEWRKFFPHHRTKLRISVIDETSLHKKELLELKYPQLNKICEIVPLQFSVGSVEFERAGYLFNNREKCNVTSIYICPEDDSSGLSSALVLQNKLDKENVPIVISMNQNDGLAKLITDNSESNSLAELNVFNLFENTCEPLLLIGGLNETLARAIHGEYLEIQSKNGKTVKDNPSAVPWNDLPEYLKESNRLVADNIINKLNAVGCGITPMTDWDADSYEFNTEEIELMAEMEHKRWMNERLNEGWTYAPEKNIKKKTTPYLVNWLELPGDIKQIDRDLVTRIPEFLAKIDLQVYRVK